VKTPTIGNHLLNMIKNLNRFIIFLFLIIFPGCNEIEYEELTVPISFKEYFVEMKNLNLVSLMEGIMYFGPGRPETAYMEIYYTDSTRALFKIRNYKSIDIIKHGLSGIYTEERILSDIEKLYKIYKRMHLKMISGSDVGHDSTIEIWFDINIIKKETLPHYENPMDTVFSKKFPLVQGELYYSLNDKFEEYEFYKNTQPVKLEDRWYYECY
jgi:hypothetical protein